MQGPVQKEMNSDTVLSSHIRADTFSDNLCQRPQHVVLCTALRQREQSLLSIQGSSHHPPRRRMFSSLQQPFLIWPALGWHIPEPKCTHKLLSLVVKLFTPEWLLSGTVGHSQLDYADKEKLPRYIISTPFDFRNACLDPFCSQSLLLPSCFLEGHQPAPILTLHPANIGSCSWRQNIIIHKVDHV